MAEWAREALSRIRLSARNRSRKDVWRALFGGRPVSREAAVARRHLDVELSREAGRVEPARETLLKRVAAGIGTERGGRGKVPVVLHGAGEGGAAGVAERKRRSARRVGDGAAHGHRVPGLTAGVAHGLLGDLVGAADLEHAWCRPLGASGSAAGR